MPVITTRFANPCNSCGSTVPTDARAFFEPSTRKIYHLEHAPGGPITQDNGTGNGRTILLSGGNTYLNIAFPYEVSVVNALKRIPTAKWNAKTKEWDVHLTPLMAEPTIELIKDFGFVCSSEVIQKLNELIHIGKENLDQSRATEGVLELKGFGNGAAEPYPFQRAGIAYAIKNRRVIIADEQGLGKTIQGLGIYHMIDAFCAVVVAPAITLTQWERQFIKWIPEVDQGDILRLRGRKSEPIPSDYRFILLNWDILDAWVDELNKIPKDLVILDEIHYAKSGKSKRGTAAVNLALKVPYVVGLSGTPMLNKPKELINPLKVIGRLKEFGDWHDFTKKYCGAFQGQFGWNVDGATNLKELNDKLRSSCWVRRNKVDVLTELPLKTRVVVPIELDKAARKDYDHMEADLATWLGEQAAKDKEFLKSIAHLDKETQRTLKWQRSKSKEMRARGRERLLRFVYARQHVARLKLPQVKEWTEEFLESAVGDKLILFAIHREIQGELWDHFKDNPLAQPAHIFSKDSYDERQAQVDKFMQEEDTRVIICSFGAANAGIDLYAASHVAFSEFGWNPGTMDQAEDRAHRIGQTKPVTCYYLAADNTIDEDVIDLIDSKREIMTAAIVGTDVSKLGVMNALVGAVLRRHKLEKLEIKGDEYNYDDEVSDTDEEEITEVSE